MRDLFNTTEEKWRQLQEGINKLATSLPAAFQTNVGFIDIDKIEAPMLISILKNALVASRQSPEAGVTRQKESIDIGKMEQLLQRALPVMRHTMQIMQSGPDRSPKLTSEIQSLGARIKHIEGILKPENAKAPGNTRKIRTAMNRALKEGFQ